jgi:hypothetical protein
MQGPEILPKGATAYTAKATETAHGTINFTKMLKAPSSCGKIHVTPRQLFAVNHVKLGDNRQTL